MTSRSFVPALAARLRCVATPAFAQSPNLANPAALREQAPASYKAKFDTTKGVFVVEVHARLGAERRRPLLQSGEERFLRQRPLLSRDLRLHGAVRHQRRSGSRRPGARRRSRTIRSTQSNKRGIITFAMAGPNTRTTRCSSTSPTTRSLDEPGFAPFGRVVSGMNVVDALNAEYGEGAPRGRGPDQSRFRAKAMLILRRTSRAWTT